MAAAKITLIGFYNYMDSIGDDLFAELSTPSGIDKDEVINNILMRGGEYEVLWGDPFFYKTMIGVWSKKWQHTMERWIAALSIDYNPLENYDRMEDWIDNGLKNSSVKTDGNENAISSSNSKNTEATSKTENALASDYSESTGDGTTENQRSAFDAATYQPHDKAISDTSGENKSSAVTSANGATNGTNDNISNNISSSAHNQNADTKENQTSIHSGRLHGNIGVTTSQQMLQSELDIAKWNLYDEIADLFVSEMLIYVD